METTIFNKTIDYKGQDLHMLRNDTEFPLHLFFNPNLELSYTFRLNGEHLNQDVTYEQIEVKVTANNATVFIKAEQYIVGTDPNHPARIDNFFVTVKSNNPAIGQAVILIHLHDEIDKAWTSPNTLSLRNGMRLKFGVLVSFTDGNYGDISFYPTMERELSENAKGYLDLPENEPQRITLKPDLTEIPADVIEDAITIQLPKWMNNEDSKTLLQVKGNVHIVGGYGNLKFHKGDIGNINSRLNLLFLSDGFKNSTKAFHNNIDQFTTELLTKETYSPWNLLGDSLNIWSYYTDDKQEYSSLEGDHIFIRNANSNNPIIIELYAFISLFDSKVFRVAAFELSFGGKNLSDFRKYIRDNFSNDLLTFLEIDDNSFSDEFPFLVKSGGQWLDSGLYLSLSDLCSRVGLPSQYNMTLDTLANNLAQWRKLGWVNDVTTNAADTTNKYLHPYVFKIWKKLQNRILLEKTDTSYGVTNTFLERSEREKFQPTRFVGAGFTKFRPTFDDSVAIKDFGSYINKISNTDLVSDFGKIFYEQDGTPKYGMDKNKFMKYIVKPSDNIIILSRVRTNGTYGVNEMLLLSDATTNPSTPFSLHRTIASVEAKLADSYRCRRTQVDNSYRYEQSNLDVKEIRNKVKNTIVHELSHNYLRDEYSAKLGDFNLDPVERLKVEEFVNYSNLQLGESLKTQTQFIDGSLIKWNWPRIEKIGLGVLDKESDNIETQDGEYLCIIQTNAKDINKENSFKAGDKILLRKRFLFDNTTYIVCTVNSVTDEEKDYLQKIKFSSSTQFNPKDYDDGFIIILPYWRSDSTAGSNDFKSLVHHEVQTAITNANYGSNDEPRPGRPLVYTDDLQNNRPQHIDEPLLTSSTSFSNFIAAAGKNKSNIVGLYAGGLVSYRQGIYHPSGFCTMRGFIGEDNEFKTPDEISNIEKAKLITSNSFCPVCSYILIDYIDPLKHPDMDQRYGPYI